jgi:hypothetical protein
MIDRDIWITANEMIKQFGAEADLISATRADAMLERGDIDGQKVWRLVLAAVRELINVDAVAPRH